MTLFIIYLLFYISILFSKVERVLFLSSCCTSLECYSLICNTCKHLILSFCLDLWLQIRSIVKLVKVGFFSFNIYRVVLFSSGKP